MAHGHAAAPGTAPRWSSSRNRGMRTTLLSALSSRGVEPLDSHSQVDPKCWNLLYIPMFCQCREPASAHARGRARVSRKLPRRVW